MQVLELDTPLPLAKMALGGGGEAPTYLCPTKTLFIIPPPFLAVNVIRYICQHIVLAYLNLLLCLIHTLVTHFTGLRHLCSMHVFFCISFSLMMA